MIHSAIRMQIPFEKQGEALEILGSLTEQTQFEPGCVNCRLYRSVENAGIIMLEELWLEGADIKRHLQSDNYKKILLVIEMAEEPPEIRFNNIAHSSGVETIEKARNKTEPMMGI